MPDWSPSSPEPAASLPRVVHVVRSLEVGGLEKVVCDLVRASKRVAPSVICLTKLGPLGEELKAQGVPIHVLGIGRGRLRDLWRASALIRSLQPAVLHCHNLLSHLNGSLAALIARGPHLVLTKHGAHLPQRGYAWWLQRQFLKRTHVVAVSQEIHAIMQGRLGPGGMRSLHYIPNGIELEAYRHLPSRSEARRRLGWPESAPLVGLVARLSPGKGHEDLLAALVLIRRTFPEVRLLLVGEGPMRPAIEETMAKLGVREAVQMLGERRDVPQLLAACDLFVLPSRTEGVPITILEAMAARLPVVASDVGGIPHVILHGQSGLLVPPQAPEALATAISTLLRDPARAQQMSLAGRRRVEAEFEVGAMVDRYERLYLDLLAGVRIN
jgi:glycosyltransferase involved in cell wall biosynthesis